MVEDAEELAGQGMGRPRFPLAAIGASAGGLQALRRLLPALPAEPGLAIVVVLHLARDMPSHYDEILQHVSAMPVVQVKQHPTEVLVNHIYLIAPGTRLKVEDNYLFLDEAGPHDAPLATIDYFLHALALSHRRLAIGVLLSGMNRDGCSGLAALREQGATCIVQLPADAEQPEMPQAAIDAGLADIILPAGQIGSRIVLVAAAAMAARAGAPPPAAQELQDILLLLYERTGHDFRGYKRSTILRRLERRLHVHGVRQLADYRALLQGDGDEARKLLKDLLVGVTGFFRDRAAFDRIGQLVLPDLLQARAGGQLRVWVAACSTGQEAYSLAMLMSDLARSLPQPPRIHIFATDIDEQALGVARAGIYPASIQDEVPGPWLERYFVRSGGHYRVRQLLREQISFASHNLLRDPPFSGLDLVSCRNFMIYLDRDVQSRVLQRFHFALRAGGHLFLGSAESADSLPKLFARVDRGNRIYQKLQADGVAPLPPPTARLAPYRPRAPAPAALAELHGRLQEAETGVAELQSNNEELITINAELKVRLEESGKANDDLNNMIASVDLATLFVDPDLNILRFTPRATSLFNLIARDVGRSLNDITNRLDYPELAHDVRRTFEQLRPMEREVPGRDGRHFIVRILPYRTSEDVIEGAVLTFFDISLRRQAEDQARAIADDQEFLLRLGDELRPQQEPAQVLALGCRLLAGHLGVPLLAHAEIRAGRYVFLPGFADGLPPLQGEGALQELGPGVLADWHVDKVTVIDELAGDDGRLAALAGGQGALLAATCRKGDTWLGFFLACQRAPRAWTAAEVAIFEEAAARIGVEFERARAQLALGASESLLRTLLRGAAQAHWESDAAGMMSGESPSWQACTGQTAQERAGEGWVQALHPEDRQRVLARWREAVRLGQEVDLECRLRAAGGGWRRTRMMAMPLRDAYGAVFKWVGFNLAVDEQAQPASVSIGP